MTRHYNCGIEFLQALEHPDPVCAACVRIGHDGEEAVYHHVPAEQNALLGKKNKFITTGVCRSPVEQLDREIAEVYLSFFGKGHAWHRDSYRFQQSGNFGAEPAEHVNDVCALFH